MERKLVHHIFCDGACSQNGTWNGGYGVVELVDNTLTAAYCEQEENTTNNIMELKALYAALQLANNHQEPSIIYIDSAYALNAVTVWSLNWSKNGWINSKKEPVANKELIQIIYNYYTKNFVDCKSGAEKISFEKIRGHRGIAGNELADSLARHSRTDFQKLILQNNILVNYDECKNNFTILSS